MKARRLLAAGLVLGLAGLVALWATGRLGGLTREPLPTPRAPASLVPADASAAVWLPRTAEVLELARDLSVRLEGSEGIGPLVAELLGVDAPTDDALIAAGLVPAAPVVLVRWRGAVWGAVQIAGDRGLLHLLELLGRRGLVVHTADGAPATVAAVGQGPVTIAQQAAPDEPIATLWREVDLLVVRFAPLAPLDRWLPAGGARPEKAVDPPPAADAAAFLSAPRADAAQLALPGAQEQTALLGVWLPLGDDHPLRTALRDNLGYAKVLFGGALDRLRSVRAALRADNGRLALDLRLGSEAGRFADIASYHQGFAPPTAAPLDVAAILPDETALAAQWRLNPRLVDLLPSSALKLALALRPLAPLHASLGGLALDELLLEPFAGRLGVGLLGLDDRAPLNPQLWKLRAWRGYVGVYVAVALRDVAAAQALTGAFRGALAEAGVTLRDVRLGEWRGWAVDDEVPWMLLSNGAQVVWCSGRDEEKRLRWVADGRFPSLQTALADPIAQRALGGGPGWGGVTMTTPRFVRALRRRGVPDHFVGILGGLPWAALHTSLGPDGLDLSLVLRLGELEAAP